MRKRRDFLKFSASLAVSSMLSETGATDIPSNIPRSPKPLDELAADVRVSRLDASDAVEILGAADASNASGVGGFRLRGRSSKAAVSALQASLQDEFGIFTVVRSDLASGCCIGVTPQAFTPASHLLALADAVTAIAARA